MDEATKDLKGVILIFVILFFVWLFTGGPLRPSSQSGWSLTQSQIKTTQEGGQLADETNKHQQSSSSYQAPAISQTPETPDQLIIRQESSRETKPDQEYIELRADRWNKKKIKITDWKLSSKNGFEIKIGQGAPYVYSNVAQQPQADIHLNPGEKAIVITGKSPLGTSFQINKCMGYLKQFHEFTPNLYTNCPVLKNEAIPTNLQREDFCLDAIDRIPECKTIASIPYEDSLKISSLCQAHIVENTNYASCAEKHKSDIDFYLPEWRIYLQRGDELWKDRRETISIYNEENAFIDSISY